MKNYYMITYHLKNDPNMAWESYAPQDEVERIYNNPRFVVDKVEDKNHWKDAEPNGKNWGNNPDDVNILLWGNPVE